MSKLGSLLVGMVGTVVVTVSIINISAGIVGGIWLLFLGQWWWVFMGIIYSMFGHYMLAIILLASLIFGGPGVFFFEKRKYILATPFILLNQLFIALLIYLSVMYVFGFFTQLTFEVNAIPVLLLAYAVAFAPWSYMAQQDRQTGNENAHTAIFSAQAGFILGLIIMFITGHGVALTVGLMGGLILGILLNLGPVIQEMRYANTSSRNDVDVIK